MKPKGVGVLFLRVLGFKKKKIPSKILFVQIFFKEVKEFFKHDVHFKKEKLQSLF